MATQAVEEAGEVLVSHFQGKKEIRSKGRSNLVTDADLLSEKVILGLLKSEYPSHGILSEESDNIAAASDYTWIVDPLDGTNNYVFGLPFFCTTIALAAGEDILLGVTYAPLQKELFRAQKGQGAYLNGSPISVSSQTSLPTSSIGLDMGYDADKGRELLEVIRGLWPGVHSLRIMGSAALGLAYVACGRLGLYFHRSLYPWDLASGILLVRESGGTGTDWEGKEASIHCSEIIAANATLHQEFLELLQSQGD